MKGAYIIPIVGHPHLGPDEDDLAVVNDHSAVVWDILV
jgi:hypothetical protein